MAYCYPTDGVWNMMNTDKLVASLANKITASVGHRADLEISDVRRINSTTAHFLVTYASEQSPSAADLNQFFLKRFDAKVVPYTTTAKLWASEKAITVVAGILNITREYEDIQRSKMIPVIAGYSYLDVPMQEKYEVQERNGKKVLVKKVKEDIMAIVGARKQVMMDQSYSPTRKTFANVAKASGLMRFLAEPSKGDLVRVMHDDKHFEGEVMSVSADTIKVKGPNYTADLPKQAVLEVIKKKEDSEEARLKSQEDYYSKAYGSPEYAKKLAGGK